MGCCGCVGVSALFSDASWTFLCGDSVVARSDSWMLSSLDCFVAKVTRALLCPSRSLLRAPADHQMHRPSVG